MMERLDERDWRDRRVSLVLRLLLVTRFSPVPPVARFSLVALVPLVTRVARFPHITRRMCAEEAYA
jgi:hypothetical protein